jgi:hypothetical protein
MFFGFRKSSFGRRRSGVGHKIASKCALVAEGLNSNPYIVISTHAVTAVVGYSPLNLDESPFMSIRQDLEPHFVVQTFDE